MIDLSEISYPENIDSLYRYDPIETKKIKYLLNFILKPEKKQQVVDGIFDKLKDESEYSKELYMTVNDISKLSDLGYLGTHSDLHLPLATLEDDLVKKDIQNSISFLQDECGAKEIKSISYPYGGPKAVSTKVAEIAASFGFTYGLTMFRGINNIKDFDNPLMLKRVDTNDAPGGKSNNSEFCL
jgi:peptidoglycan/xylan/chitin deacetylase (PgdA/CDA1 family)